ncbi:MAG: COX15/CtaA family protein [Verrucomicrobia bacterium]|nr:COX15/CtaA family protein [Verrucomicrobiota bacterium]
MTRSPDNPWLHRFAVLTAVSTLALIGIGGLVTSHGAGLAVPDWPTSYGYNMFLFPPSYWVGGILYEHTHRLFASFVGLLTTVLAVWLWIKEPRRWLRWAGVFAFFGVVFQGVLGGLRVTLLENSLGIVHAAIAQLFVVLVSLIALWTSRGRALAGASRGEGVVVSKGLLRLMVFGTLLIFLQLILGATMRHQHAGLAVPDFPLAYGKLWPAMDPASIEAYNRNRLDVFDPNPITAFQIGLHMIHRLGAFACLVLVGLAAWFSRARLGSQSTQAKLCMLWFVLVVAQAGLGAATVLSNKAADIATAHVVLGAASLVMGAILWAMGLPVAAPATQETECRARADGIPAISSGEPKAALSPN